MLKLPFNFMLFQFFDSFQPAVKIALLLKTTNCFLLI